MNQWESDKWAEAERRERESKQRRLDAEYARTGEQQYMGQGGMGEAYANMHKQDQAKRDELRTVIAKAVYPWIGSDADGSSQGIDALNKQMAYRAADNVLKGLKEAGYDIRK